MQLSSPGFESIEILREMWSMDRVNTAAWNSQTAILAKRSTTSSTSSNTYDGTKLSEEIS
jgi:hypothetical protein